MNLPAIAGCLHGCVLRPPVMRWDGQGYTGSRLLHFDDRAAREIVGVVSVVRRANLVGIVAATVHQALLAMDRLELTWSEAANAIADRRAVSAQDDACENEAYRWRGGLLPAPEPWAIGWRADDGVLTVWAPCHAGPAVLHEIAAVCDLDPACIRIVPVGAAITDATDLAVEAAWLAMAVRRPVRVSAMPSAVLQSEIELRVARRSSEAAASSALHLRADQYPRRRPSIAALLSDASPSAAARDGVELDLPLPTAPALGAVTPLWRDTGNEPLLAHVFAQESALDEEARQRGGDPIALRLAAIDGVEDRALVDGLRQRLAVELVRDRPDGWLAGRGFACAHVLDAHSQPPASVWAAWLVDVAVDPRSGTVAIERLTVGQGTRGAPAAAIGQRPAAMLADAGSEPGRLRSVANRLLAAGSAWRARSEPGSMQADAPTRTSLPAVPIVDLAVSPQSDRAELLAWTPAAEVPASAAIANAIRDATGIRLRSAPFDFDELKRQLDARGQIRRRRVWPWLAGGAFGAVTSVFASIAPWQPAIATRPAIDPSVYSAAAIERGRLVAAAGDCAACHTREGGVPNAGGHPIETPFGVVYASNITPDPETGIGGWSLEAFERAMRHGVGRDGRHLYPAFPYTSFARMSDADLQALYAYLMVQPPVRNAVAESSLRFPFNLRPLLAGWKLLYHDARPFEPDTQRSAQWNRGAYLVDAVGHCSACHSPRNALGAERNDAGSYLSGSFVDGWYAPALDGSATTSRRWGEDDFYRYLRTGHSPRHGVAAGPMSPVLGGLNALPDSDIAAIAHYLYSLQADAGAPRTESVRTEPASGSASASTVASALAEATAGMPGYRLFSGACAGCHEADRGPAMFGVKPLMANSSKLRGESPETLIRVILDGVPLAAGTDLGAMPAFRHSLGDRQIADIVRYLRARHVPEGPQWSDLETTIAAVRGAPAR